MTKDKFALDCQQSLTSQQQYVGLYHLWKEPKFFCCCCCLFVFWGRRETWKIPLDDSNKSNQMMVFTSELLMWYLTLLFV